MVTVAPGATAMGYLYPCWGAEPAPAGSTDCFALMMYSDPMTTSPGPGDTGRPYDASLQESSSGRPGVPSGPVTSVLPAGGWAGGPVTDRAALGMPLTVQL